MEIPALRPRSATEILDGAFQVLRREYPAIAGATGVLVLPAVLLGLILPESLAPVLEFLERFLYLTGTAATVVIVSDLYLGKAVDVRAALRSVFGRFPSVLGASVIQGLLVMLGFLLLVVPGFLFLAWTFAMPIVVMVEGCRAGDALDRSRSLARGSVLRILGTLGLAYLLFFAGVFGLGLLLGLVGVLGAGKGVADALLNVGIVLLYPFPSVVATLLYFDLRIRREAFDVEVMAEQLDSSPSAAAPAALTP